MNLDPESLATENERLRQAVDELSVLNEIVTAIGTSRRIDHINRLILSICIRHFGVEQGVIHLLDFQDPQDLLRTGVRVHKSGDSGDGQDRYRLGMTLTGWIVKHREPLVSDNLAADGRFPGVVEEIPHVRSVLAVPLLAHRHMLGILSLFNKLDGAAWTAGDQRLLGIIAVQSAQVIEAARLQEMEEDLRAARSIQQGLLPKSTPHIQGLDLFGYAKPAHEVGGDYYDWLELPNGRLGCVVADVSGKGMPAALTMAQLQAAFRAQALTGAEPAVVVTRVNEQFGRTLEVDRFVTLFYAVVDPAARRITYANAGHDMPFVWRGGSEVDWLAEGGMILGRISRKPYCTYEAPFAPGDGLVIYTDGVTEAATLAGEQWDRSRLRECVLSGPHDSARAIGERIRRCVETHTTGHKQTDDITLAVVRHMVSE